MGGIKVVFLAKNFCFLFLFLFLFFTPLWPSSWHQLYRLDPAPWLWETCDKEVPRRGQEESRPPSPSYLSVRKPGLTCSSACGHVKGVSAPAWWWPWGASGPPSSG
ncbi:hypothetical protein BKA57DRAFT_466295, partial [Linnemannia elongata]